jgi:hypothetical protein
MSTNLITAKEAMELSRKNSMPKIMSNITLAASNGLTSIEVVSLSSKDRLQLHELGYDIIEVLDRIGNSRYNISWNGSDN